KMSQAIFVKRQYSWVQRRFRRARTTQGIPFDAAKPSRQVTDGTGPNSPGAVHEDSCYGRTREPLANLVMRHSIAVPMPQTFSCADPEASIRACGKRTNELACELRAARRLPRQEPGAIEVQEPKVGTHPQIAIRRLGERK